MPKDIMNTNEMIDSIIADFNNVVKACVSGQYILFCGTVVQIVQKLTSLKTGISEELCKHREIVNALEIQIKELGGDVQHFSADELDKVKQML